jgi:ParB/RepB/Spo0J family partition protein
MNVKKRKATRSTSRAEKLGQIAGTYGQMLVNASTGVQPTGDLKSMAMESIEPDPEQPRHNKPTDAEIEAFLAAFNQAKRAHDGLRLIDFDLDAHFAGTWPEDRRRMFAGLVSLAHGIEQDGLIQPIKVVRTHRPDGTNYYRIEAGERRYLAHRLLGRTHIVAIQVGEPETEAKLRRIQFTENFNREDLSLADRMRFLRDYLADVRVANLTIASDRGALSRLAEQIRDVTGMSLPHAQRHAAVLDDDEVLSLTIEGRIQSLATAYLAAVAAPEDREAALARALAGEAAPDAPTKPGRAPAPKGGRPRTSVSFGKTKHPVVARHVIEKVAGKEFASKCANVDWEDLGAVAELWNALLEELEAKLVSRG